MKKEVDPTRADERGKNPGEELDSLNAAARDQGPGVTRKHIEANIEEKARRRRAAERSAATGFKKT